MPCLVQQACIGGQSVISTDIRTTRRHRFPRDSVTASKTCDTGPRLEQNVECLKFLNLVQAARARVRWLCNVIEGMRGILMGFVTTAAAVTYHVQAVKHRAARSHRHSRNVAGAASGLTLSLPGHRDRGGCISSISPPLWNQTSLGVFDMPNPNRYDILSMSIFYKITLRYRYQYFQEWSYRYQYFQKVLIYHNRYGLSIYPTPLDLSQSL